MFAEICTLKGKGTPKDVQIMGGKYTENFILGFLQTKKKIKVGCKLE